jgi:hypothetical protein
MSQNLPMNIPVNMGTRASDYLYMGKPITQNIDPFIYLAESTYVIRQEPAKSILEHLGTYQLIEGHFDHTKK